MSRQLNRTNWKILVNIESESNLQTEQDTCYWLIDGMTMINKGEIKEGILDTQPPSPRIPLIVGYYVILEPWT